LIVVDSALAEGTTFFPVAFVALDLVLVEQNAEAVLLTLFEVAFVQDLPRF